MNSAEAIKLAILLDRIQELATKLGVVFETEVGQKNIRIVQGDVSTIPLRAGGFALTRRSVHAFVDIATGDLLKAAGWKAPAKGARGNLLDEADFQRILSVADRYGRYLYLR